MKKLALTVLLIVGCGKGSDSPATAPNNPAPKPGPGVNQVTYTLTASRAEPGDVSTPGLQSFTASGSVVIPAGGNANSDATDNIYSTLAVGAITCSYHKVIGSSSYVFVDCSNGATAGQTLTFTANTTISYSIASGYCTQNCNGYISIVVTQ